MRPCSKALEFDPYSARALYRRAIAKQKQGTNAGLEEAVQDLRSAQSLEPSNAQVSGSRGELELACHFAPFVQLY